LALFTKTKAFFSTLPAASHKTRIPAGDPLAPLLPASSVSPRAFHTAHGGDPSETFETSPLNGPGSLPKIEAFRSSWNAQP
jgi:hypothetical protein